MKRIFRIIIDIVLFFLIINGIWFIALPLSVISAFIFENYFEIILFGIMYDSLFGYVSIHSIYGYLATIFSVFAYIIISVIKKTLR